jgi:hypothetical protein
VNPVENLGRGRRMLRDRIAVAAGGGDPLIDWVNDQLARPEPARPLAELQQELDSLVPLETVKDQVRALIAFLRILGNPGTGKTTIARLLAQMYRSSRAVENAVERVRYPGESTERRWRRRRNSEGKSSSSACAGSGSGSGSLEWFSRPSQTTT